MAVWARTGRNQGKVKYRITPPPFGLPEEVECDLARPVEGYVAMLHVHLDPKERYTVAITNSSPDKKLHVSTSVSFIATE